jgi:hypothetical protein
LAGKLGHRGVVAAVCPGRLFFVTDSTSQRRYLVDTGSAFSIMPWQSSAPPSGPSLAGADGRRIPCWGERFFTVTIGGVPRQWQFLLAAISFPILGEDFLRHHSLVVDVANLRLSPPPTPVGAVTGRRRHPWAVLRGRRPLFARGLPAGTARLPHLPWRLLSTFTLFLCRRRPLWLAGGAGRRPPLFWRHFCAATLAGCRHQFPCRLL